MALGGLLLWTASVCCISTMQIEFVVFESYLRNIIKLMVTPYHFISYPLSLLLQLSPPIRMLYLYHVTTCYVFMMLSTQFTLPQARSFMFTLSSALGWTMLIFVIFQS